MILSYSMFETLASIAANTTIPIIVPVQSLGDSGGSLTGSIGIFIAIISGLLSMPGLQTFISHVFGKRKEEINADATLLGTVSNTVISHKDQIKQIIDVLYAIVPEDKKSIIDEKLKPILQTANVDAVLLNSTMNNVVKNLHPSARAAIMSSNVEKI